MSVQVNKWKVATIIMAIMFVLATVIGNTSAWLSDKSERVVNTFTYGDINISLAETDTGDDVGNPNTNVYEMVPGTELTKDPEVTVLADSLDSWLFVKLEKSANYDSFMEYEIADGWTALAGVDGVYYRETVKSDKDQKYSVLKDNKVTVKDSVTKDMLNALDSDPEHASYPTLSIIAYAVQKAEVDTVADAWALVTADSTTP